MSNNILSGNRELHLAPIELDLNTLYHPPKQPLTALGVVSAFIPLFGYGWQAMTQIPRPIFATNWASASTSTRPMRPISS